MSTHGRRAIYTYAVARPLDPAQLSGLRGVDGTSVHLIRHDDLVAVVSTLRFTEAELAALRARLENPAELEAIARAHHDVVGAVFEHSVTLPFRLATIHQSEQRLLEVLRAGQQRFNGALDQLAGRVEIGVKLYVEAPPTSFAAADAQDTGEPAGRGRDYLRRRRDLLLRRQQAGRRSADAAARIGDTLARIAADHRFHRLQDPRLSGVPGDNVLNAAYLVDAASTESFVALARSLDGDLASARVEITGPWPPYSFAEPLPSPGASDAADR
jgi:gas vesicle protein GvpL/GvpF